MDDENSNSIGVDELEDPLIALGLVDNRQQVQQIVQLVDEDGSKMIEFEEFLKIIKSGSRSNNKQGAQNGVQGTSAIFDFFKKLTRKQLRTEKEKNLPFSLFISSRRREKLIQAITLKDDDERKRDAEVILNNYRKQLAEKMARDKVDQDEHAAGSTRKRSQHGGDAFNEYSFNVEQDFMSRRMDNYDVDPPDPNVLKSILNRKSKFDKDLKSNLQR